MDFALDDEQRAVLAGLDALLDRVAPGTAERAQAVADADGLDAALAAALDEAGFCDVALDAGDG
ncbi:MAG: hypothetical protein KC560_18825, partial [Myxococcales bacterium]|nr:hypothetical protein [Myxococcales bacterium]